MTRISCPRFRSAEVRLSESLMVDNPGNLWRRLVMPKRIDNRLQRLVKPGGRMIKLGRNYWLPLAEAYLTRRLFGAIVPRIGALLVTTD
jgi:hypothetical protein